MGKLLKIFCLVALLLTAVVSFADQQLVQAIMQKSGLNKQIEQFPAMVQAGMAQARQQAPDQLPEKEFKKLGKVMGEAFNAKGLRESVQKGIQKNLPEKDMQAVLAWLSSPLGEKITGMEEAASSPAAYAEMQKMGDRLMKDTARVQLVKKLDKAVKATEGGVDMAVNAQVAMITGLTASLPAEQRPSVQQIKERLNKNSEQMQSMVAQQTLYSFLYTYRNLSDAELNKYVAFAQSPSGKKYHEVIAKSLSDAILQACGKFGGQLVQALNKG